MAETIKRLGTIDSVTTEDAVFTVPDLCAAVAYVVICNPTASSVTADVRIVPGGETAANKHYINKGLSIAANDSFETVKVTMSNEDSILVTASDADVTFNCFGSLFTQPNVYIPTPP